MAAIAVVTEALSPSFYFPLWYQYYSKHLNSSNFFVVSPGGQVSSFADYNLGGVITIPSNEIDERKRTRAVGHVVAGLLSYYDLVIRVDTDELLVPDPRRYPSLADYLTQMKAPYVTAVGLDIFQHIRERPLDSTKPILMQQRRFAYLTPSMSKTAICAIPIEWGPGFHFSSVFPKFEDLFLLHLKRADIGQQMEWFAYVSKRDFADKSMTEYYAPNLEKLKKFHESTSSRHLLRGWEGVDCEAFKKKFFKAIRFDQRDGMYRGAHFQNEMICEMPAEFEGAF